MTELMLDRGEVNRRQITGFSRVPDVSLSAAATTLTGSIFTTTLALLSGPVALFRARRQELVERTMRRPNWFE